MTIPTPHDWSLLGQLLQRDGDVSRQLLELLREEREVLEQRDYPRFEALVPAKKNLIEQLERHRDVRRQHLRQMGFDSDTDALRGAQRDAPAVAATWEQAAVLWRECQHASGINDQISRRTRIVVEQILDTLRGQHSQSTIYDASGGADRSSSGRTLGSA